MIRWSKLVRDPVVHFLLIGAALYLVWGLVEPAADRGPQKILVTRGQVEALALGFTRAWKRPPTTEELEGLIRDLVREEIYSREAMALGLAEGDDIIRRRMRQKLEFLTEDSGAQPEPTDDELRRYLDEHPDSFGGGPRSEAGFQDIRNAIRAEWMNVKRKDANEKRYQEMLSRYTVIIERPGPEAPAAR